MSHPAAALPLVRIGIVVDGPQENLDHDRNLIQKEIIELTKGDFEVKFPEAKFVVADWTIPGIRSAINRLLEDPEVDMILTWGVLGSHEAGVRPSLSKPTVAPFVLDRIVQGFPYEKGASGRKNLTYIASHIPLKRHLEVFQEVVPFNRISIIYNPIYTDTIPELMDIMYSAVRDIDVESTVIPIQAKMEWTLASIPKGKQAVFVTPLITPGAEEFQKLVEGLKERRLPSFSVLGREEVDKGILAGIAPLTDMKRITRRIGLVFQRILLGEEPGTIPVAFKRGEQLVINMETARAILFYPSWDVLTEAELLFEEKAQVGRRLTLEQAVQEAVSTNLDLAAFDRAVAAGVQDVREARSILHPQVEISSLGLAIDEDRAKASFGRQAERTLTGSLTLFQLLYDESANANVDIQGDLLKTLEFGRDELRSNIAQEGATAYLNILKIQTLERIEKDNMKLTRSNLELANTRQNIGISGPAEVYRWEAQMARDRITVVEAQSQVSRARIDLNRILSRSLEEPFVTEEVGLEDPALITSDSRILKYLDNPWTFGVFRDFMVREGLASAPELKQLTAAINARERALLSAKRDFTYPTLALEADVTQILAEGGEGSQDFPLDPDNTDWTVGVNISVPLTTGGARGAEYSRSSEELDKLRLEHSSTANRVEQRIRSALHVARASFVQIKLARDAAYSSRKNLELVTDSYARGAVAITQLLDAQNALLNSELAAANAVYDFMIDLMEVERSVNRFGFFISLEDREQWFESLNQYFITEGVPVPE